MKKTLLIIGLFVIVVSMLAVSGCAGKQGGIGATGATGAQGIQGERGDTGAKGAKGDTGTTGATGATGVQGAIGNTGASGYGATGATGATGEAGADGANAYEVAVADGFGGTETEWLASLVGAAGVPGIPGYTPIKGVDYFDGVPGATGDDGISGAYAILIEKNSVTWQPVTDGAVGLLLYDPVGSQFEYVFEAYGLEPNTSYRLIYYADFTPDRFDQWGGNNPGALLGTFTADTSGNIAPYTYSLDLGMNLPCLPDANMWSDSLIYDYSLAPDYYAHAFGAKIWLVPSDCYDAVENQVIVWSPTEFLFETDLIVYIDTDN